MENVKVDFQDRATAKQLVDKMISDLDECGTRLMRMGFDVSDNFKKAISEINKAGITTNNQYFKLPSQS